MDCVSGKYRNPSSGCASAGSSNTCYGTPCPSGKWGPVGMSYQADAVCDGLCPAGKHGTGGTGKGSEDEACEGCPSGRYGDAAPGQSNVDSACPEGTACAAGRFGPRGATTAGAATCADCPAGWTVAATGATACTMCPEHHYCAGGVAAAPCPAGKFGGNGPGLVSEAEACTACPAGWAQGVAGQAACNPGNRKLACCVGNYAFANAIMPCASSASTACLNLGGCPAAHGRYGCGAGQRSTGTYVECEACPSLCISGNAATPYPYCWPVKILRNNTFFRSSGAALHSYGPGPHA